MLSVRGNHDAAAESRVRENANFVAWNPGIDSRVPGGGAEVGSKYFLQTPNIFASLQPAPAAHIASGRRQLAAAPRPARPQEADRGVNWRS